MQAQSEIIRQYILKQVDKHPKDIARVAAEHFSITRQAVNRHLKILIEDGILQAEGNTKERTYWIKVTVDNFEFPLASNRDEDQVYRESISPLLAQYSEAVQNFND